MKLLRLAPENTKFPFMRFRRVSYPFSAFMSIVSVVLFLTLGMNFGIDFSGGTLMELRAKTGAADISAIRSEMRKLTSRRYRSAGLRQSVGCVAAFRRADRRRSGAGATVARSRHALGNQYDFRRVEVVGPRVSGELVQSGTLGVVISIIAVLGLSVVPLRMAVRRRRDHRDDARSSADRRLLLAHASRIQHDVDRGDSDHRRLFAERNRRRTRPYPRDAEEIQRKMPTDQLIDMSVNAVLPRTIMTATTVFLALLSLVIFGGEVIRSFSLAMIWGIFVATYSSVFICSPMLIYLGLRNVSAEPAPTDAPIRKPNRAPSRRRRALTTCPSAKYSGFLPGRHVIEGYGDCGFTFAGMSHRGSILALPSGIYAWDVMGPEDLGIGALAQVFAEPKGEIEHLLIGTGVELRPLAKDLRAALNRSGNTRRTDGDGCGGADLLNSAR